MVKLGNGGAIGWRITRRTVVVGGGAMVASGIVNPRSLAAQLLDPSQMGRQRSGGNSMPQTGPSPNYARSMATQTVSALTSLVSAYAISSTKTDGLKKQESELRALLGKKRASMVADLEEYRQGLFCSGCGKTRRQILSEGDQFPHPGQTIIQPTPEQIDAKARSLQADIDNTASKLDEAIKSQQPLEADRTRIKNEMFEGAQLWRSAVGYEDALIFQQNTDAEREYQEKRAELTSRIKGIEQREQIELQMSVRQGLANELILMATTLKALQSRRETQIRGFQLTLANADDAARLEGGRFQSHVANSAVKIVDGGNRGFLDINGMMLTKNASNLLTDARVTSGRTFQMGDYSPATWGAIRPDVAEFLDRAAQRVRRAPGVYYPSVDDEVQTIRALATKLSMPHPDAPSLQP